MLDVQIPLMAPANGSPPDACPALQAPRPRCSWWLVYPGIFPLLAPVPFELIADVWFGLGELALDLEDAAQVFNIGQRSRVFLPQHCSEKLMSSAKAPGKIKIAKSM